MELALRGFRTRRPFDLNRLDGWARAAMRSNLVEDIGTFGEM